jgi:hypothetical protein
MQLDYHYYVIFQLAKLAGFDDVDSSTIAYASQYVDDSTESEPIEPFPDQHFDTVRTAHYNLEAFNWNVQKKIYMPFHFLPAKIRWKSPKDFTYVTKPASLNKEELPARLVKDAISEENHRFRLIRLGVALHTVADTFSHFGFSGRHNDENNVGRIWHKKKEGGCELQKFKSFIGDIFVPRIGHVEAFEYPDQPFLEWRYTNNKKQQRTRDNLKYSIKGVKLIYHFLKLAKYPLTKSVDLEREHSVAFRKIKSLLKSKGSLYKRCDMWKNYTGAPEYKKTKWRQDALKGDVEWDDMSPNDLKYHTKKLKGKAGFDTSKWAYFHRAAFKQRSLVIGWLN